jgi:hypothetical protein
VGELKRCGGFGREPAASISGWHGSIVSPSLSGLSTGGEATFDAKCTNRLDPADERRPAAAVKRRIWVLRLKIQAN